MIKKTWINCEPNWQFGNDNCVDIYVNKTFERLLKQYEMTHTLNCWIATKSMTFQHTHLSLCVGNYISVTQLCGKMTHTCSFEDRGVIFDRPVTSLSYFILLYYVLLNLLGHRRHFQWPNFRSYLADDD